MSSLKQVMACQGTRVETVGVSGVRLLPSMGSISLQLRYGYCYLCFIQEQNLWGNRFASRTRMLK